MEIRNLLTFTKVAEVQSLSGAARELGYAQSTVTMQMQQLEQELGVPIYERIGKQIRITQEGRELLKYAASIVRMSEEALLIGRRSAEPVRGSLRLGVAEALAGRLLARQLRWFAEAYPEAELDVRSAEDSGTLITWLLHNDLDLMLIWGPPLAEGNLICAHSEPERMVFAVAADHPLSGRKDPAPEDLKKELLICGAKLPDFGEAAVQTGRRLTVRSHALAVQLALEQGGILAAPESLVQDSLADGRLTKLPCPVPDAGWQRQTVYHRNKWRTRVMEAWIRMLEEHSWE